MGKYLDSVRGNTAEPVAKEAKKAKEGSDEGLNSHNSLNSHRTLPPDELENIDLRFRIVGPDKPDAWSLDDWLDWISERSSILEFDGDYSKEQADHEAMLIWKLYRRGEK